MSAIGSAWLAIRDLHQAICRYRFWLFLGFNDILKQYRRSFLGPVWISLNTGIFIAVFSLVGSQLFGQDVATYAPYFCVGFVVFGFLSSLVNEGCQCFISSEGYIKQSEISKMIFPLQVVIRNFIIFAHNLVVIFLVLAWSESLGEIDYARFLIIMSLVFALGVLVAAILGVISARFRDVPLIVATLTQTLFFLTPVMWRPEQLTERAQIIVSLNPLAMFLEAIRSALLGDDWSYRLIIKLACASLAIVFLWFVVFGFGRRRIAYWV